MFLTNKRFVVLSLITLLVLVSCNINDPAQTADAVYTQAAETALAAQTETSQAIPFDPTATFTLAASPTLEASNTPLITNTFTPGAATNTPITFRTPQATTSGICDNALFVADVTIPDYSEIPAGTNFVKTWTFKNLGPCTWTTEYRVVFSYVSDTGKNGVFTPPAPANFPEEVIPGDKVDVSITLTAPTNADGYIVVFRLQNDDGFFFGPEFWVTFVVK